MQIFNEINARKLGDNEYNVFAGFFNNFLFLGIVLATMAVQVFMVQYGGASVRTIPLTVDHHLICLAIGMFSLINGIIIKMALPVSWFAWLKIKDEPMAPEASANTAMAIMRKPTFRKSHVLSSQKVKDLSASQNKGYSGIN